MRLLILALAGFVAFTSAMSDADVKKNFLAALESAPLGSTPEKIQNGKDFYKFLFTNNPEVRKYFKGAESFTADDVQKSDRFATQGSALLTSVHILADTYDNEMIFRAFVRDLMNRHKERGLDPKLWKDFWGIFEKFLNERKALSADQKTAIETLGTRFNEEAQKQLGVLGLPHT
ncbi:globin [Teladorsagia circumcincta]|uniref:Globin n=1 Tax=Teladorsagia circumcincta TaxID=45464 RepID=A0A2G9UQF8_TELCI|nr:globin [Teladorsagia circumcincta]